MNTKKHLILLAGIVLAGITGLRAQTTYSFKKDGKNAIHRFEFVEENGWLWFRIWKDGGNSFRDFRIENFRFRPFKRTRINLFDADAEKIVFVANTFRQRIVVYYTDHKEVYTDLVDKDE